MLGYFSLVGLLRVHSILGDYPAALASMAPLHPFLRKSLFTTKIPMANITLFYYIGFAYVMMQVGGRVGGWVRMQGWVGGWAGSRGASECRVEKAQQH